MSEIKPLPVWVTIFVLAVIIAGSLFIGDRYELPTAENISVSVMLGVVIAFLGYIKSKPPEEFDPAKFIVTPIVGAIAGTMAARYGYTYEQTVTWLVTSGFMLWIEYAGKSIVRRFWK